MKIIIIDTGETIRPLKIFQISDDSSQIVDETTIAACTELSKQISSAETIAAIDQIPKNVLAELMAYVANALADTGRSFKTNDLMIIEQIFIAHYANELRNKTVNDIFHNRDKYKKLAVDWVEGYIPKLKGAPAPGY